VLLDGKISTVDTRLSLNGNPILPEMLPPLGLGDSLKAQGALHVPLQIGAGAVVSGTDHLLATEKIGIANSSIGMLAGKTLQLKERGSIEGFGAVMGKLVGGVGSAIKVTGGDLKLGAPDQAMAVDHDGDIHVEAGRTLELESLDAALLGGKVNLGGGSLGAKNGIGIKKEGRLSGSGVVQGAVKSKGVISPGASFGALQFEDGLELEQDSVLELELGLLGGVLSYDQLLVDGTLSLGGLLRIILTDDYMPSAGDFADLLVADSMASVFASLELIAPGRQISWTAGVVDLPDARQAWRFEILSAQAVDEPSVPALVGSALLAFVGCRRRRSMPGAGSPGRSG
jgi:hypothetical protein